jgi:predicted NAD-dependent protein-ADP-ribosyltransferase YbiA (DUF1768 family)
MDIRKAEYDQLKRMLTDWIEHPTQELEATFGEGGQVNSTTFAAIGKRLKNRGYTSIIQEDKLNIITPKAIRISLTGLGVVQHYCKDDRLAGKEFSAMIKDKSGSADTLDLEDYNVRVKMRNEREVSQTDTEVRELVDQWAVQQKAFRLLRRWTFRGEGLRFDLSMVKQTQRNSRGEYRWATKFTQQDISKELPVYEVEVELERMDDDTPEKAMQRLIKGVGEVLRGIQKSPILIKESTKRQVMSEYQDLTKTNRFRGAATLTLELANMISLAEPGTHNIRQGYNVTDKADGLRTMGFVNEEGHLYLIDQSLNVYETGQQVKACAKSLVDGEWITKNSAHESINQYLIFDIYYAPGAKDVHALPFYSAAAAGGATASMRYNEMRAWEKLWNTAPGPVEVIKGLTPKTKLLVSMKRFRFGGPGDLSIFQAAAQTLDAPRIYETDGLIFMKNESSIPDDPQAGYNEQFKWKPPKDNTIDFMVVTEKLQGTTIDAIHDGFHPTSGKNIRYKVLRLHVGSREDPRKAQLKPRDIVLQELPLQPPKGTKGANVYRPVLFYPEDFPDEMANTCYVEVTTDQETGDEYAVCEVSKEPIMDKSIVEISYDASRPAGWRWVPKLVRADKTERLLRGELGRTLNSNMVAQSTWKSIHEPVTTSMIRSGNEEPLQDELTAVSLVERERAAITKKYADRTAPEEDMARVRPLRDFHNQYIKETILYSSVMKKPNLGLIDIGMGVAQDIQKWRRVNAGAVLGIDIAGDSINNPNHGAYQRLWSTMLRNGRQAVLPMAFAVGDASRNMASGEAGIGPEDKVLLQSVLGRVRPEGVIPPYIENQMASRFKAKADVISCMFATHYFFASKETFDGFLQNIAENLKVGGYFIGCCFDGEKTFEFLKGRDTRLGQEGETLLWKITKKYDNDEIPAGDEAFGMPIDVEFISIGMPHREFLVPFGLLQEKMRSIGCELCNPDELKELGLQRSTALFSESHAMAARSGRKFPMTPAVEQFSFLNRWFIFRRKGDAGVAVGATGTALTTVPGSKKPAIKLAKPAAAPVPVAEAPDAALEGQVANEVQAAAAQEEAAVAATASAAKEEGRRQYSPSEVLQFYQESPAIDRLKIGDKLALRHIAPGTPFIVTDPVTPTETYPSIEHFMAAMRYKVASDKPGLAQALFSPTGRIHQKFLRQRDSEKGVGAGAKQLTDDREAEIITEELKEVHNEMRLTGMKKNAAKFDEAKWNGVKDDLLKEAVRQRYSKDARFRTILEAAKQQGKTLLFYTGSASSEYGGKQTKEKYIEGENKLGKAMMEAAGFEV